MTARGRLRAPARALRARSHAERARPKGPPRGQLRGQPRFQTGLTLIELLISSVISLIILAGAISLVLGVRETSRLNDAIGGVQENVRLAGDLLNRRVRLAGSLGCLTASTGSATPPITNHLDPADSEFIAYEAENIGGTDGLGYDYPDAANQIGPSDSVTVTSVIGPPMRLLPGCPSCGASNEPRDSLYVNVVEPNELVAGTNEVANVVLLGDCTEGDIFQVTNDPTGAGAQVWQRCDSGFNVGPSCGSDDDGQSVTLRKAPLDDYERAATTVQQLRQSNFSVRDLAGGPALAQVREPTGLAQGLVQGTVDMQVFFGEDENANGVVDRYLPADDPNLDFDRVTSVRIALLFASTTENVVDEPQTLYYVDGSTNAFTNITMPDRRFYSSSILTVALRNRLN